jgi:hypothetical protein
MSWRKWPGGAALLLSLLALPGCGSGSDQAMADKLAAAQAAADRAVAAQHAAEKAALEAAANRSAAPPAVVSDNPWDKDDDSLSGSEIEPDVSLGGEGSTVSSDGTVIPGRGA